VNYRQNLKFPSKFKKKNRNLYLALKFDKDFGNIFTPQLQKLQRRLDSDL
jgi:hypothetical protein